MDLQPDKEIVFQGNPSEGQLDEDEEASKATVKIPADEDLSGRENGRGQNVGRPVCTRVIIINNEEL